METIKCFFTDIEAERIPERRGNVLSYQLKMNQGNIILSFNEYSERWVDDSVDLDKMPDIDGVSGYKLIPKAIKDIKYIVRSLILNGLWNTKYYDALTKDILLKLLNHYDYPKTPEEKFNYLFNYLFELQKYDGDKIYLEDLYNSEWQKLYLKNDDEFAYYLNALSRKGLIDLNTELGDGSYLNCCINYDGILYKIELDKSGKNSNNCFVAMSFDDEDIKEIYLDCLFPLINDELKFNPILIKDEHFESDKTINDAMIASIKKSRFIIADFTKQKRNVYFEAGYAAGLGLKVIYTCKEEHFKDKDDINKQSAFDTNHFPHIIWKDKDDLRKQLKDKIEAYIY